MIRPSVRVLLAALSLVALTSYAKAHPQLQSRVATVGASYRAILTIPHGCDGSPTVSVHVRIPEGVIGVKPMPKAGWTIETVRGPYAHAYDFYHGQISEGVKEITWSGRLSDDYLDDFTFAGLIAGTLPAGEMLYFPVDQHCEKGATQWSEIPAAGQSAHALKSPAPGVMLIPAADKTGGDMKMGGAMKMPARTYKLGAITVEAPWARATAKGMKVGGGYLKITNTGTESDKLIGGTLAQAGAAEVHEMSMTNDVMRMRRLADGLEIAPGKTVELKPGSYHMMFFDLSAPLTPNQAVKGTLVFQKAGTLEIEYQVAPAGATSGGAGNVGGHMHH